MSRNFKEALGGMAIVSAVLYLAGAFASATFDITQWAEFGRLLIATIWGFAIFFVVAAAYGVDR